MKIVKDKNNVVVFAEDGLDLTEKGLIGPGYRASFCTTKDYTIEYVDRIPDDWRGGHYTFDGAWTRTATGETVKALRDIEKEEQARVSINYTREKNITSGMEYTFPDGRKGIVDIKNDRDILNIIGIGAMATQLQIAGDTTTKLYYTDETDITHEMAATDAALFGIAFFQWYAGIYRDSWAEKGNLKKST